MTSEPVRAAADRLIAAATTAEPCPPVRDLIGSGDLAAAYAVQREVSADRLAKGARVIGRKIGLTSPAVQAQLGVDQPDFGSLFDDTAYHDGATIPYARLLQPRIEAEVAFVLGEDLAEGDLSYAQVRDAVEHAVAAMEVADSRIARWDITFGDTVADNASAGVFVLGAERRALAEVSPRDVTLSMTVTGQEDSTGTGAACLGDPLLALQWLATTARELGDPLRAGQIVLSGALGPMRPVLPGATATATITGLGTVTVSFSEE
ncbi:2-hydroxypentadienoate hydratase [Frankia sp. Hr75.2]|nr:2-hydroxypentadienoate hydratase [Frankia sp. Hr75.2]